VTVMIPGPGRRAGALMALKLASFVLRGGTTLYQHRAISRSVLRVVLSASQALERAGVLLALGRRISNGQPTTRKDENNGRAD
jgi:hypothetical protein